MSAFKETSQLIYVVIFNKIRIHDGNDDHSIVIIEKDSTMSHYMLVIRPQPDDKGIDKIVWTSETMSNDIYSTNFKNNHVL